MNRILLRERTLAELARDADTGRHAPALHPLFDATPISVGRSTDGAFATSSSSPTSTATSSSSSFSYSSTSSSSTSPSPFSASDSHWRTIGGGASTLSSVPHGLSRRQRQSHHALQSLRWAVLELKQDEDGDQAHEFLGPF